MIRFKGRFLQPRSPYTLANNNPMSLPTPVGLRRTSESTWFGQWLHDWANKLVCDFAVTLTSQPCFTCICTVIGLTDLIPWFGPAIEALDCFCNVIGSAAVGCQNNPGAKVQWFATLWDCLAKWLKKYEVLIDTISQLIQWAVGHGTFPLPSAAWDQTKACCTCVQQGIELAQQLLDKLRDALRRFADWVQRFGLTAESFVAMR